MPINQKYQNKVRKTTRGFTIIELLVVVSIIALLSSIVLVSLTATRNRAKDAKIETEIHAIILALEAYNASNGGYPNPLNETAPASYCIGGTDCLLAGNPVSTQFPDLDEDVAIQNTNLALVFPNYPDNISFFDEGDNENKGYIYVSCGSGNSLCNEDLALLIYPTTEAVITLSVGSFEPEPCEFAECQDDYGENCGGGNNESCINFSNTAGACNYDIDGTGSSSGNCSCGYGDDINCSNYCNGDGAACNYDIDGTGGCDYSCQIVYGCTDPGACNYNSSANNDDGSCDYSCITNIYGCMDPSACNYNPNANLNDGSCDYSCQNVYGCTDPSACNYNPSANSNDGSCEYMSCHTYSCQGTPNCDYYDGASCGSQTYCSWTPNYSNSCIGTYTESYSCSDYSYDSCPSNGTCYGIDNGFDRYCDGGTFYNYGDCSYINYDSCNNYSGCSQSSMESGGSCSPNLSCSSLSEWNCSSVSGCSWTY